MLLACYLKTQRENENGKSIYINYFELYRCCLLYTYVKVGSKVSKYDTATHLSFLGIMGRGGPGAGKITLQGVTQLWHGLTYHASAM